MRAKIIRGFTLPELMITLGIVAIVLSTAVPAVNTTIRNNRLASQLNSVMADIHFARSEAAKRDVRVIMCRSIDPNLNNPTCSGDERTWTTGYIIFADDGNYSNNTYEPGTDILLRRGQQPTADVRMRTNGIWDNALEFNSNGSTNEGGIAIMSICDYRGEDHGRQIIVARSGIPKMYASNIDNCIPNP
jgi:type IV fimbrial biogenesis protein FimT